MVGSSALERSFVESFYIRSYLLKTVFGLEHIQYKSLDLITEYVEIAHKIDDKDDMSLRSNKIFTSYE